MASINATVNLKKTDETLMEYSLNKYVGNKVEIRAKGEFGIFEMVGEVMLEAVSKQGVLVKGEAFEEMHYIAWSDVKSLSVKTNN